MGRWSLEILSTQGNDRKRWQEYVEALPDEKRDVYFLPDYAALYEGITYEPAFLFRYGDQENGAMMVAVMRSVSELPFHGSNETQDGPAYFDISTPYGYGGPVIHGTDPAQETDLFRGFRDSFHAHCVENNIVTEFLRLHPLMQNHEPFGDAKELYRKNSTVWIDLRQTEDAIFQGMRKDHRKNVGKAARKGVEIVHAEIDTQNLKEFHRLYTASMERLNALPMYFFPFDFIKEAAGNLKGNISCFLAMCDGTAISAHLVLHSGIYIHNFLSGSDSENWNLKPDVLMTYEVAKWAKEQGYSYFHLGGGHAVQDDSLFHFKSGFSPNHAPYYMYRQIHNEQAYETLCQTKIDFERATVSSEDEVQEKDPVLADYFPAYRG